MFRYRFWGPYLQFSIGFFKKSSSPSRIEMIFSPLSIRKKNTMTYDFIGCNLVADKVAHELQVAHKTGTTYSGFCSMKATRNVASLHCMDGMLVHAG